MSEPDTEETAPASPLTALLVPRATNHKSSVGASVLPAPSIVGLEVLDAHAIARQAGLRVAVDVRATKLGPWGMILAQRPEPGTQVRLGERIHVTVAGRPHLTVPDVRGLWLEAAVDRLRRSGLEPVVTAERGSRTLEAGVVISTRPVAGTLAVDGSQVALTVSRRLIGAGRTEGDPRPHER